MGPHDMNSTGQSIQGDDPVPGPSRSFPLLPLGQRDSEHVSSNSSIQSKALMSFQNQIPHSFKSELFVLIASFLEETPETKDLAQKLKQRLTEKELLTPRYDWTGKAHTKSFEQVINEVGPLPEQHLLELSFRLCGLEEKRPGVRTLLGLQKSAHSNIRPQNLNFIPDILRRQEYGISTSRRHWDAWLSKKLTFLRRTLGHLSCVYCLVFDRSGKYLFTGADDLLVKCWRVSDGRLIHTFRGSSSEISDLAVSHDNKLIAAGSCDKIIRVWCLQSGAPLAVLSKHSGMITAIHFCPHSAEDEIFYLASTSGDGTVSFWRYRYNEHNVAVFDDAPTRYHEKIRPGQAQMLCASFSPGGLFFCVGSADHNVRVYQMRTEEGPRRILEEEVHQDRVSCIQWCNKPKQMRFISGSKDGTAIIWTFKAKRWHTLMLNMKTGDNRCVTPSLPLSHGATSSSRRIASFESRNGQINQSNSSAKENYRVTMVAWSLDDSIAITAVSDHSLRLWNASTGLMTNILRGHQDEIFVLEPHPTAWNLLLSAAHDGQIAIWDLNNHECLFKHKNFVEDQGEHAPIYDAKWSPDGFTVTATDSHGHLLFIGHGSAEKYDKLPVELFFHTDYRPLLRDSFQNVVDEQTQVPPHLLPPPFLVDSEGSPYPAYIQKFVPGREKMTESEAVVPAGPEPSFNFENPQPGPSNRDSVEQPSGSRQQRHENMPSGSSRRGSENSIQQQGVEDQGAQQQMEEAMLVTSYVKREIIPASYFGQGVSDHLNSNQINAELETSAFDLELSSSTIDHNYSIKIGTVIGGQKDRKQKPKTSASSARRNQQQSRSRRQFEEEDPDDDEDQEDQEQQNDAENDNDSSDVSLDESDLSPMESTSEDDSSDHSYWGSDGQEDFEDQKSGPPLPPKKKSPKSKKKRNAAQNARDRLLKEPGGISDEFVPSSWLSQTIPKKSPYFPQIGDVLMYFKQGHQKYIDLVKARKVYEVNMREQEWMKKKSINDFCPVKVLNMKFEIRPPRLCVLKLAILNPTTLQPTRETFSIKYHDMNDVVDFLILYDFYKASTRKHWKNGDRIRCQIDDCWWKGTVKKIEHHDASKRSPFLSIFCHWDNGEKEYLSPWDLEGLDQDTADIPDGSPVTPEQMKACLYQPTEEEWNSMGIETETRRITEALESIMELAISEPFNYPVDLTLYPEYMLDIEYPVDLTLIKSRLENHFYRRIDSLIYDIQYIAANAATFNQKKSLIVKNAKILSMMTIEIIRDSSKTKDDVSAIYHRLVESFEWSESDEEEEEEQNEESPDEAEASLRSRRRSESKTPPHVNPKKWKQDCDELLTRMANHPMAVPFREPVNEIEFPDYHRCITTPMDISTVREFLHVGEYDNPLDMQKDVNLIFKNSREYNTDPKAKIIKMTNKLEDWFNEEFAPLLREWRKTMRQISMSKKRQKSKKSTPVGKGKGKGKGQSNKIKKSKRIKDDSEDEESELDYAEEEEDDEDEDASESDAQPKARSEQSRKSANRFKRVSFHEDDDEDGEDDDDLRPLSSPPKQKQKSPGISRTIKSNLEPLPSTSSQDPVSSLPSSSSKRISPRNGKPPIRYNETDRNEDEEEEAEEEEEDNMPLARRANHQRSWRPSRIATQNAFDNDDENNGTFYRRGRRMPQRQPESELHQPRSDGRPKRRPKPLRCEGYDYYDENENGDLSDSDNHRRSRRRASKRKMENYSSEEEDEDDIPLARSKLSVKGKNGPPQGERSSRRISSTRPAPKKKRMDDFIVDDSEDEDTDDEKPLRMKGKNNLRSSRRAAAASRKKIAQLDMDSSDHDIGDKNQGKSKASVSNGIPVRSKARKRRGSESEYYDEDNEVTEDSAEESEGTFDDEEEEEEEEEEGESSESRYRKRPQRRAAMQPKLNSSKRAAKAIDSESEHTSARRPARLRNQNRVSASSKSESFPPASRTPNDDQRIGLRDRGKRSYAKFDESEDEADDSSSGRENRRPRREAAQKSRRTLRDVDSSHDDDEQFDRPKRRSKPNPRIL